MLDALQQLERELSEKHGKFKLFGVFLREDSVDRWDIVVAAPWLDKIKQRAIALISDKLKGALGASGLMNISRVVRLSNGDEFLAALNELPEVEHGLVEIANTDIAGVPIRRGYIVTGGTNRRR